MRSKLLIIALLGISTLVYAQSFSSGISKEPTQGQQLMTTGSNYSSPVYEPFNPATPADQSYSPAQLPGGGPRRTPIDNDDDDEGWTDKTDTQGTDLSPVGDAVVPLLLMAAVFAGVIAFRRRKTA